MKTFFFALIIAAIPFSFANAQSTTVSPSQENRKKIANDILNNLVKQNYEGVRKEFHSTLRAALPVEKVSEAWNMIATTNGEFEKVISITPAEIQGYQQIKIRCKFKNENVTLEATFNEDDKVIGLYFKP